MTTETLTLERDALLDVVNQWNVEQESLDAEWQESLAALSAFQSHLDAWQQDLARERQELQQAREEWERERAAADSGHDQDSTSAIADLTEAKQHAASLSEQLAARVEELRLLGQQRAEALAELEAARAQAAQLTAESDEQRQRFDAEQSAASEQVAQLQAQLAEQDKLHAEREAACQLNNVTANSSAQEIVKQPAKSPRKPAAGGDAKRTANSPVLGSIVEQFGKLRQQRASERQASKKQGN